MGFEPTLFSPRLKVQQQCERILPYTKRASTDYYTRHLH